MADRAGSAPRAVSLIRRGPVRLAVAPLAGLLMALGHAPFGLWWSGLAGIVLAIAALPRGVRRAALHGWLVGAGFFGLSLAWIVEPFFVDPEAHGWMAPFALAGMAGGLALFWAAAFGVSARAGRPAVALVPLWALAELGRAHLLTGFPWGMPGYQWLDTPVAQWAAVLGPHGLTFATFALAALLAASLRGRPWAAAAATLAAALWGGGMALTPAPQDGAGRPVVRLVQPNAPQDQKWDPARAQTFYDRKLRLGAAAPAGPVPALIVWPETALPMLLRDAGSALARAAETAGGIPIATGVQRLEAGRYFNALAVTDAQGVPRQVYDKHHLVPFGEYMPFPALFERLGIPALAVRAQAGFAAGPGPRPLAIPGLGTALPLICYEAVFPHAIARAGFRPDWLLHVTNDAWFGSWSGPYQHLAQARFRAIEQGLPVLRAANTGVSAAIDGAGRVLAQIPLNSSGFVDAALPAPLPPTPYSRTGDWSAGLAVFLALVLAWRLRPPLCD